MSNNTPSRLPDDAPDLAHIVEFKNRLSRLLDYADNDEKVVIHTESMSLTGFTCQHLSWLVEGLKLLIEVDKDDE